MTFGLKRYVSALFRTMQGIDFRFNPENRGLQEEREYYIQNPTELCLYGLKYGSDKTPINGHTYTPIYHKLFNEIRANVKNVVELGLGDTPGCVGASLKMWRDFFKNANIIGLDYNRLLLFKDERITTYFTDQHSPEQLLNTRNFMVHSNNSLFNDGIDIFIDDGSHGYDDQMRTLTVFWPLVKSGGYFIIEDIYLKGDAAGVDITFEDYRTEKLGNILSECEFFIYKTSNDNHLIIYKKL